jgi:hypothetical protein
MPLLVHPAYLGISSVWVRTKEYMEPTEIDKGAGKRRGYVPDYSVWLSGVPLLIVEAKSPEVAIEGAIREARIYALEINKRYPPNINPIGFILGSNGVQVALCPWDSETQMLIVGASELALGSSILAVFKSQVGRSTLSGRAEDLSRLFQSRQFHRTSALMGGMSALSRQLGVNEFAEPLFPVLTKYFGNEAEEATDDIIKRGYIASEDTTSYGSVLETYLKDRVRSIAGNQMEPIVTSRHTASKFTTELRKFSANPAYFGRVQLVVGSVGSGKSTFIKRFYKELLPEDIRAKTYWAFLDFNVMAPDEVLQT